MKNRLLAAALGLVVLWWSRASAAEAPKSPSCAGPITRSNAVACSLAASPPLDEQLAFQRAAEGRREAARPFLPSNPTLAASVGSRVGPTDRAMNWSVSLGQELEIAGQSGLRVEVADKELRAQLLHVKATRREVAAQGWVAYFTVLAAQERLTLAAKLENATGAVFSTVRGMAANGLASEVDADIAESAALRATHERLALEGALASSKTQLNRLTGGQPGVDVEGILEPIHSVAPPTPSIRPELLALQEQQAALQQKVELFQRERVPNPTVSLFVQNDGFQERVLGVGLSIPLPLPQPVGRSLAGEIAEAKALAERAGAEAERVQRELRAELAIAKAELDAASKARQLYTSERSARAATRLESIALQVRAARLPVRDALVAQQALFDQLKAEIEAREALCLASVRVARAVGTSLEGDAL